MRSSWATGRLPMIDARIYRTGLAVAALVVVVVAFSLHDQQPALGTTLAPEAFNGQNAFASMKLMASTYPQRRPGSPGDNALAAAVAKRFRSDRTFAVSTDRFSARTADGTRTLQTVRAVRTGLYGGSIVIVAHRDSLGSPATADLSGTATLLELGRVLSGETLHRTIVLVSTSGSVGTAGAAQLARSLAGSVDAVVVLGDLAGTQMRDPILVPWSNGQQVAPPMLRNTVAAALGAQTGLRPGGTGFAGQLAHLAFPLTVSEQGPFGASGEPAVLLSLSGAGGPPPGAAVSPNPGRIGALGRTVLQSVSALDGGSAIPAPAAYLLFGGKVIPAWAIRLLVLALILPVVAATLDGLARARRRGHSLTRWLVWVLAGALPFVFALALVLGAKLVGLIAIAPPGPVGAGIVPLRAAGSAVLVALAAVLAVSLLWIRPVVIRLTSAKLGNPGSAQSARDGSGKSASGGSAKSASVASAKPASAGPAKAGRRSRSARSAPSDTAGAAPAVLLVMCAVSLVLWAGNPFTAALMLPALHLWIWVLAPSLRGRSVVRLALLAAGLAPAVLVVLYYAATLGLSPVGVAWNGALLIAGGQLGLLEALEWSVALGCALSVAVIALGAAGRGEPEAARITVRGPISYAGPGSLGGTESALRR